MIRTLALPVQARRLGTLAEAAGAFALLTAAGLRLVNLDQLAGKFDEGIRGAQLLLMAAGYRPFRDIFASQGPLSLDLFYPTFMLFGQTLGAARLAPALFSLVGLLLVAAIARAAAGPVAGATAGLLLLLSPVYLKNSRLALVEVPALAPALAAVGAALAYQRWGDRRWLAASGALLALALLTKPMVLPAAVPIALAVLLRPGQRLPGVVRDAAIVGGTCAAIATIVILAVGPADVYDQMVRFRIASRQVEGWSLKENWTAISGELVDEGLALHAAAAVAGLLLLVARPRLGVPLVAWPLATFALLMAYSPIQFKHAVIMLPPLALLVGVGAGAWWSSAAGPRSTGTLTSRLSRVSLVVFSLALWYVLTLPSVLDLDRRLLLGQGETRPESYDDEVAAIGALTGPREFIVSDEPAVAFATRRLVPPRLVDTSAVRIRSRSLGATDVIAATEAHDVKLLFLFSDGLRSLRRFAEWVDERYVTVKINERRNGKDRALYLRRDADLDGARALFERSLDRSTLGTFGGQLRLLGHSLERGEARAGGSLQVTLGWQAVGPMQADYSVLTILRDAQGRVAEQTQRGLGGGGEGTSGWEPGRWVIRSASLPIRASTAAGDYRLSVSVYDSRARRTVPLDAGADELSLTTVRVRG